MERATRTTKDQVKNVQSGYDARHPKQVERFLGSLNMFRSKKDVGSTNAASIKPPMPNLLSAPIDIPDTSAIISSIRQGQSQQHLSRCGGKCVATWPARYLCLWLHTSVCIVCCLFKQQRIHTMHCMNVHPIHVDILMLSSFHFHFSGARRG